MDDNTMLYIVKLLYHDSQMKNSVKPDTNEEREKIITGYDNEFPKKLFKLSWMNWWDGPAMGMDFPKDMQTWIIDSECIGYYAEYWDGTISPIVRADIKKETYDSFKSMIEENFKNEKSDKSGADGEGWQMILYDETGNIVHEICGYINGNEYLSKIVEFVEHEHGFCKLM